MKSANRNLHILTVAAFGFAAFVEAAQAAPTTVAEIAN